MICGSWNHGVTPPALGLVRTLYEKCEISVVAEGNVELNCSSNPQHHRHQPGIYGVTSLLTYAIAKLGGCEPSYECDTT